MFFFEKEKLAFFKQSTRKLHPNIQPRNLKILHRYFLSSQFYAFQKKLISNNTLFQSEYGNECYLQQKKKFPFLAKTFSFILKRASKNQRHLSYQHCLGRPVGFPTSHSTLLLFSGQFKIWQNMHKHQRDTVKKRETNYSTENSLAR